MSALLIHVLMRRKLLLGTLLVSALIFTPMLHKIIPKSYTVTNSFRIGRFMGEPLEMPEFTRHRLKRGVFLSAAFEAANLRPHVSPNHYPRYVRVSIKNNLSKTNKPDTLIFTTRANTPEMARAMSQAIGNHLVAIHGQQLLEARTIRRQEISQWRKNILQTREKLSEMETLLSRMVSDEDVNYARVALISSKLPKQRQQVLSMMRQRQQAILAVDNPVLSFNTKVVGVARSPNAPSSPRLGILLPLLMLLALLAWLLWCWLEFIWAALRERTLLEKPLIMPTRDAGERALGS